MKQAELFDVEPVKDSGTLTQIAEQAIVLRGFAVAEAALLLRCIEKIDQQASFRHMLTPGGHAMSVAMTNCGHYGWYSDERGYRYTQTDPVSGQDWPKMPDSFINLAIAAAYEAGFEDFHPDACLINRYDSNSRMGLHQDKDEQDLTAPIVSVSLGAKAEFLFGGFKRRDKPETYLLQHGDVVVWGGKDRLRYHGIKKIVTHPHSSSEQFRFNLTFRQVM